MLFKRSKNGASTERSSPTKTPIIEVADEDLEYKIEALQKALKELKDSFDSYIKGEIEALKIEIKSRTAFMEQVVIKLLDKPAAPPAKTAVEIYKEAQKQREEEASKKKLP